MNSLEYIDLLIKSREEEVNRYTKVKNNLYDKESEAYYEKEMIGRINEQIQHLQQIKTELEAWEVVKDKINITEYYDNEQDYEEDINSHNALCLNSNLKIQNSNNEEDWFIPLDNEDCKKLKKALEVKDE
jgi:hypothetical protein